MKSFGDEALQQKLLYEETQSKKQLCLWHRTGVTGHEGNFGPNFECLDCMKEIKEGKCLINIEII